MTSSLERFQVTLGSSFPLLAVTLVPTTSRAVVLGLICISGCKLGKALWHCRWWQLSFAFALVPKPLQTSVLMWSLYVSLCTKTCDVRELDLSGVPLTAPAQAIALIMTHRENGDPQI